MPTVTGLKKKRISPPSEAISFGMEFEFEDIDIDSGDYYSNNPSENHCDLIEIRLDKVLKYSHLDASGRDGDGIEIVMDPFSFEYLRANKDKLFSFFNVINENPWFKGDDSDRAGIHIHVDRNIFTTKQFIEFINFLRKSKALLHVVSNRRRRKDFINIETECGKDHAPFTKTRQETWISVFETPSSTIGNNCLVLNNHGEHGTIECRFFNATLSVDKAFAYLCYVRALCYFVKSARDKTVEQFLRYIVNYKDKYPELINLLVELKLLTPKALKSSSLAVQLY